MSTYQLTTGSAPTRDPGVGLGSAIGALAGLLGPVLLGLLVWGAFAVTSDSDAAVLVAVLVVIAVVTLPLALIILGFALVASDQFPGWGPGSLRRVWDLARLDRRRRHPLPDRRADRHLRGHVTPHASTPEPSSRAAAVLVCVGFGLVTPLVGAVLSTVAMERYAGEGHLANFVPVVLVTATAALLGPLLMLLVGAFSRSRESLRLLATACFAGALTWVVVVLLEVSALIAKTVWLSAAIDGSHY